MRLPKMRRKPRTRTPNSTVFLVVGLRNPGPKYEGTRHNLGYEALSLALTRSDLSWGRAPSRLRAMSTQSKTGDDRVIYLAPTTFMNESGMAVRATADYYSIPPGQLLVIHDDIDLPFGRFRVQVGGGSGGHNGIRSIETALGTKDFTRLKLGVGRPPGSMDPADYVLRPFHKSEMPEVEIMLSDAADVIERWPADPARAQEMAALRDRS